MTLVPDSAATDIRVGFQALNTATTGNIGETNYSSTPQTFLPDVTVGLEDPAQLALSALPDGDYSYSGFTAHLFQVVVHELGHALGLAHNTTDAGAEMNPTSTASNRSIDPNDAAAIEQLYGGSAAALSAVAITDNGPDNYTVGDGGAVTPFAGLSVTDGASLHEVVTVTVTGGGTLTDPTAGTDANSTGGVFTESGDNLNATDYAQSILRRLVYTAASPATSASFNVEVDNSLQGSASNSNITVGPGITSPAPDLSVLDTTTGQSAPAVAQTYTGPVSGLQEQYINIIPDNLDITVTTPNWFIHSGSGEDAIAASSGTNVLDGGTGSNFLTGGSGTDTFFLDDRAATADIWSTVNNFHSGDAATIWGVTPSDFSLSWVDGQGASGYTGLTLHAIAAGGQAASLTLAGLTTADLSDGHLSVTSGTDPASGSAYMYVRANS